MLRIIFHSRPPTWIGNKKTKTWAMRKTCLWGTPTKYPTWGEKVLQTTKQMLTTNIQVSNHSTRLQIWTSESQWQGLITCLSNPKCSSILMSLIWSQGDKWSSKIQVSAKCKHYQDFKNAYYCKSLVWNTGNSETLVAKQQDWSSRYSCDLPDWKYWAAQWRLL